MKKCDHKSKRKEKNAPLKSENARSSAITDKPRNAFMQYAMDWPTP